MDAKRYVNDIARKIKCNEKKKKEIKKQMLTDIQMRKKQGEEPVTYENVSATYRLTYDEDMRLTGIYVR